MEFLWHDEIPHFVRDDMIVFLGGGRGGRTQKEIYYVRMQESASCRPFLLSFPENLCHAERKRGISLYDAENKKKCRH